MHQSTVAKQHVSAHSENFSVNGRLFFSNPVKRAPSNQFLLGYEAGEILTPCLSGPCQTFHGMAMGKN
jgi:hypothetical protein